MQTLNIRAMHDVAYERGEDFDPAVMADMPDVLEGLAMSERAELPVEAPSAYDRRRARERQRRRRLAAVPAWLTATDLVEPLVGVHGELV